jgi:hypothetical protein
MCPTIERPPSYPEPEDARRNRQATADLLKLMDQLREELAAKGCQVEIVRKEPRS